MWALIVKSGNRLKSARFQDETRRIAAQVTPGFADRVCVMTEAHLDPIEVHNAELIHSVRLPDPEVDAAVRRAIAGIAGAVKIDDLVDWIGLGGRGFRAVVRLVRTYELELNIHERIGNDAFVRRRLF